MEWSACGSNMAGGLPHISEMNIGQQCFEVSVLLDKLHVAWGEPWHATLFPLLYSDFCSGSLIGNCEDLVAKTAQDARHHVRNSACHFLAPEEFHLWLDVIHRKARGTILVALSARFSFCSFSLVLSMFCPVAPIS